MRRRHRLVRFAAVTGVPTVTMTSVAVRLAPNAAGLLTTQADTDDRLPGAPPLWVWGRACSSWSRPRVVDVPGFSQTSYALVSPRQKGRSWTTPCAT
jgi:hypothetical protein